MLATMGLAGDQQVGQQGQNFVAPELNQALIQADFGPAQQLDGKGHASICKY